MTSTAKPILSPDSDTIEEMIHIVRGKKVMLDRDLATIYGVETKRLNEQVKRNISRFPDHFMFQLTLKESRNLKSQIATSSGESLDNKEHGGSRRLPFVFTEHGAVMLASVLKSDTAIKASIQVVEAFVRLRQLLIHNKEIADKINSLEAKYDDQFEVVFAAIRELMSLPETDNEPDREPIGYRQKGEK